MSDPVTLHGYRYSVYNRIARVVLHAKGVDYGTAEVDPFAPDLPESHRRLHPFGLVPVLCHGDFALYETAAIARYIDLAFPGPPLVPEGAQAAARMAQVVAVADGYGYRPMVRQVFAHRVFRPRSGERVDEAEIAAGLAASERVLDALEAIAAEGRVLDGAPTLADCHLGPMIGYFARAPEGAAALARRPALARWWRWAEGWAPMTSTDPGLP